MKYYLTVITLLLLISCGTRKVERTKTEIAEVIKLDSSVVNKDKIETKIQTNFNVLSYIDYIEPIDTSKPLVINGITYKNARLKKEYKKDNTTILSENKVDKNEVINLNKKTDKKSDVSVLISNREGLNAGVKIGIIVIAVSVITIIGYLFVKYK